VRDADSTPFSCRMNSLFSLRDFGSLQTLAGLHKCCCPERIAYPFSDVAKTRRCLESPLDATPSLENGGRNKGNLSSSPCCGTCFLRRTLKPVSSRAHRSAVLFKLWFVLSPVESYLLQSCRSYACFYAFVRRNAS